MRKFTAVVLGLMIMLPALCRAEQTFSEAVGLLSQERTYAESGAALVKHYAPNDIEARKLYADAKGASDALIDQLLADLAQNEDPQLSGVFRSRLDTAVAKRVAFTQHVSDVLKGKIPEGAKTALFAVLGDALSKVSADLVKVLFDGGMSIWKEWRGVGAERRKQITTRLESLRWRAFSDISPAL